MASKIVIGKWSPWWDECGRYTVLASAKHCIDAAAGARDNPPMVRYRFTAYENDSQPRYLVAWDLRWQVIDCQRLDPAADLSGAMAATIERLEGDGWQAEGTAEYGFVFIRREGERRLLMLTERDPYSTTVQSFSPFR
jgi:hypothetical protein